jgi:hypothetical protein
VIPRYEAVGYGGERAPSGTRSHPGSLSLMAFILAENPGTKNLGIYNDRPVRGGRSKSEHAVSRALDVGYTHRSQIQPVLDWCIMHANELGIQAVHDYANTHRVHGDRLGLTWGHGRGWHWGKIGSAGAHWIHIELHIDSSRDSKLLERIGHTSHHTVADHAHDHAHDHAEFSNLPSPTLVEGSHGHEVVLLQQVLIDFNAADPKHYPAIGPADGKFGSKTAAGLRTLQRVMGTKDDAIYGKHTAEKLEGLTRYLEAQR